MLFKTIRTTTLIVYLLATLFTTGAVSRAQMQPQSTPCPAGWGHGSVASGLAKDHLSCSEGHADLVTFKVEQTAHEREPIAQFDFEPPPYCESPTGEYVIVVQAKASDFERVYEVRGKIRSVQIYLSSASVVYGPQPLYVRISSGICHAEAFGTFEIIAVNEQL